MNEDFSISMTDNEKLDDYLCTKILEIFNLYSDKKGYVKKSFIPDMMRFLVQFPSKAQIDEIIIPEIEDDEHSEYIKYEKFETYMLKVLRENEFQPDDFEILKAAFQKLDVQQLGYINISTLKNSLENEGFVFNEKESQNFIDFATNNEENPTVIYYEDYITRLNASIEEQKKKLMKGLSAHQIRKKN